MQITYIIQKSKRRTMSIQVLQNNQILVKAPIGTQEILVKEFLASKKNWIEKQIQLQNAQTEKSKSLGMLSDEEIKNLKKSAKKIIPERVEFWAKQIGVTYGRISIRLQSSRWGSCAANGNLNFNCLLVLMPKEILDSVVIHELCHRKHMNHSKSFYAEIDRVFLNYKQCDKWLKENGGIYLKRVPRGN